MNSTSLAEMIAFDHPNYYIEGNDRIVRKADAPSASLNEHEGLLKVPTRIFTHPFAYLFTYALTHSITHSLTHSITHSLTYLFTRSYLRRLLVTLRRILLIKTSCQSHWTMMVLSPTCTHSLTLLLTYSSQIERLTRPLWHLVIGNLRKSCWWLSTPVLATHSVYSVEASWWNKDFRKARYCPTLNEQEQKITEVRACSLTHSLFHSFAHSFPFCQW